MKNLKTLFIFLFIPGSLILLIGFYMLSQDFRSTGIMMSKYHVGGYQTITGESTIFVGAVVLLLIPFALLFQYLDNVKSSRLLNSEAKRDMEGKPQKSLKHEFCKLLEIYTDRIENIETLWNEILERYSESHRRYHTLKHLEHLFELLQELKWEVKNWDAICFSVFYHDVIYDPAKATNEEDSAQLAELRMLELGIGRKLIDEVIALILATKSHEAKENQDAKLLLDADLTILGENEQRYDLYAQMIREEFAIYPDELYVPGRIRVVEHFLSKPTIYQTEGFRRRFEKSARKNLEREMSLLKEIIEP